ncbi:MAG TPA: hypothetical protein PLO87_06805 [Ornithinibacter sp.]|jgi:uncharacterized membrane protein|nr:hypothetical protein [Ornithinibacter sp.]
MPGWRLYLSSRTLPTLLALYLVSVALVLQAHVLVFEISLDNTKIARFTPVWEAVPVLLAVIAPALIAPRLASWEALAHHRLAWRAGLLGAVTLLAPSTIPWIAHLNLPPDARWWDISWNVLFLGSLALTATAVLGRLGGPATGLAIYATLIAVQQTAPNAAAYLPFSGASTNLQPHPGPTSAAAVIAIAVWTVTLGRSRRLRLRERND